MWRSLLVAGLLTATLAAPSLAEEEDGAANRLVVEAALLFGRAGGEADPGKRAGLLEQVGKLLGRVIEELPGSEAAVVLATGQGFGDLSLTAVAEKRTAAEGEACLREPASRCLLDLAVATALTAEEEEDRDGTLNGIASSLIGLGHLAAALDVLEAVADRDIRFYRLRDIAEEQIEAGDNVHALETLDMAYWTVKTLPDEDMRGQFLGTVASQMAQAGDIAGASRTAHEATEDEWDSAFRLIAEALIEAGDAAGALEILSQALAVAVADTNPRFRDINLARIAEAQARAGDVAAARETVHTIADPADRAETLIDIAWVRFEAEAAAEARTILAEALAEARDIESEYFLFNRIQRIAGDLVEMGDTAGGLETAREISDHYYRAEALIAIAGTQLEAGNLEGARDTLDKALEAAGKVSEDFVPVGLLGDIADGLERAGDIQGARNAIATALGAIPDIEDARSRSGRLASIAGVLSRTGDVTAASETLLEALKEMWTVTGDMDQAQAINVIVENLDIIAETVGAVEILSAAAEDTLGREDGFHRDMTLEVLASARARAGDMKGALETADAIGDYYFYADALLAIGERQTEAGQVKAAVKTLREAHFAASMLDESDFPGFLLRFVFEAQLDAGDEEGARETLFESLRMAGDITEITERADDFAYIALILAKRGR